MIHGSGNITSNRSAVAHSGSGCNHRIRFRPDRLIIVIRYVLASTAALYGSPSLAGPTLAPGSALNGGYIESSGLNTTVHQSADAMVINWASYNLNRDERIQYIQPSANAISLNQILDHSASQINGRIDANGRVILVNPNGIFFGENAQINVGGLIASGLKISTTDFLNGDYLFQEQANGEGFVINRGLITASTGGEVILLGRQVSNQGLISAQLGNVILASGKQATLTFDRDGLIGFRVDESILQDELGLDPAVLNQGEIDAQGGRVLLTASASRDLFSAAVNSGELNQPVSVLMNDDGSFSLTRGADVVNSGTIDVSTSSAEGASGNGGTAILVGETVTHTGNISADGDNGHAGFIELHARDTVELRDQAVLSARGDHGGYIRALGNKVGLLEQSLIDASGLQGGGEVLIGGDRQGQNPGIPNADFVYLGPDSRVLADALQSGDGGRIIAFADNTARIYGQLYARGGTAAGNGGFIETSGKSGFEILFAPDVSATNGQGGTWLIDPYNISIETTGQTNITTTGSTRYTANANDAVVGIDTLLAALSGGNVIIDTDDNNNGSQAGNITFNASMDFDGVGTGRTLTLNAWNDIHFTDNVAITDSVNDTDSLNLELNANRGGGGNISFGLNTTIETGNGNFTASANDFNSGNTSIDVGSGTINLDGVNGSIHLGNLTASSVGQSDLTARNGSSISQQTGTNITIARDTILGGSSTSTITLDESANSFGQSLQLNATDATVTGSGSISVGNSSITNNLTLSSSNGGDLLQSTGLTVGNQATFSTTGNITFSGDNNFNIVSIPSGNNVTINDNSGDLALSANNGAGGGGITGNLVASANVGSITNAGEINVAGTTSLAALDNRDIILDNVNNTLTGLVTLSVNSGGGSPNLNQVTINNTAALNIASFTSDNTVTLTGDTINLAGVTTTGDLNLSATSSTQVGDVITQTGALDIFGTTTLQVADNTTQNIVLDNTGNDFVTLNILAAQNASLYDTDSIQLNNVNVQNNLTVTTRGQINDLNGSSSVTVGGTANLTAIFNTTRQDINLDSDLHDFNIVNLIQAGNVTIHDANSISLQSANAITSLDIRALGTSAGGSTISNSAPLLVDFSADFYVQDGQSIDLSAANSFSSTPFFYAITGQINNVALTNLGNITTQDDFSLSGDLTLAAPNINLQNAQVGGDLTLTGNVSQENANNDFMVVDGLTTLNGASITLDHSNNDFRGNVVVNNASAVVNLVDFAGGIQLGDASAQFIADQLTINSSGGNNTQANDVIVNTMALDAGTNDILLNSATGNDISSISIGSANNASISNSVATNIQSAVIGNNLTIDSGGITTLGATGSVVNINNALTVTSVGAINQAANSTLQVGGLASLTARNGTGTDQNIALNNAGNEFNQVNIINAANVSLRDTTGSIDIQGNISGFLNLQADGSNAAGYVITNSGELNVTSNAAFTVSDGESINLGNAANTFTLDPMFTASSGSINNLIISDDSALTLQGNLSISGDLQVSASDITFNDLTLNSGSLTASASNGIGQNIGTTLTVNGLSDLSAGAGGIFLTGNNDFQSNVQLNTSSFGTVDIHDTNGLMLGVSTITGDLYASASQIDQADDGVQGTGDGISVTGLASFIADDNSSIGLGNIDNQFNQISFASLNSTFLDDVIISNTGAIQLTGALVNNNLTVTSLSNITSSSGILQVNGLTQLSGNNISLLSSGTNLNDVNILAGNIVQINDSNSINFTGTSTINDSLTVTATGNVSDDAGATIDVANTASFTSTLGQVVLDSGSHDFNGISVISAGNATISDANSIDLRQLTVGGDLTVVADADDTGTDNAITDTSGNINVTGSTYLSSSSTGDIILNRASSSHNFAGAIHAATHNSTELASVAIRNQLDTQLGNIITTDLQVISTGNIADAGAIQVSGLATLSSGTDIDLSTTPADNAINSLAITNANDVLVITNTALTLDTLNLQGLLDLQADSIATSQNIQLNGNITLNALIGDLDINNNLASSAGTLTLAAEQNINQLAATQIDGANINITSRNGNISQNGSINNQSGTLTLSAAQSVDMGITGSTNSSGAVTISGGDLTLQGVTAQGDLLATSTSGGIQQTNTLQSATGNIELDSAGTITMASNAGSVAGGDISYISVGDQQLAQLTASGGSISIETGNGRIIDGNGGVMNLTAGSISIRADSGIGTTTDAIETGTQNMDIINNGTGNSVINLNNTGNVIVHNLVNQGDIIYNNDTDVTIDNIDAGFTTGTLSLNVDNGSVYGIDRGAGVDFLNIPDITADAALITVNGAFGTFERPIVLRLNSEFLLASTVSSTYFLGGPPPVNNDTSAIKLSVFDSINSVSGLQLIEVESLADLDPAIFSQIYNYALLDVSIRMPRDQVFEDQLDEYDTQQ